jgi:ribosomal protein S12 methylthiotransferase
MRFYLTTLGCPKNVTDSEMMAELLRQAGHRAVETPRQADLLIVNTCGFIAPAREESYQVLRDLAAHKSRRQKLVVAGCLAQRQGEALRRAVPGVDAIIGTQSWPEIVALVTQLEQRAAGAYGDTPLPRPLALLEEQGNLIASVRRRATLGASAYLKIADGCNAACAFCAIPLIKGPQRDKPRAAILREAEELAAQDVREVVLIAQDTTAWGRKEGSEALAELLRALVSQSPEVGWWRLMYAYPQHVTPRLVETMAALPAVCHYLDLPLQHGHPEVLRRMRRPHDTEQVYRLVEALRAAMPDVALRSSFIVGFPGESEAEFAALLGFLRAVAFDKVGVFAYSREEGTAAAALPGQVAAEIIAARYERAMLAQQEISLQRNQAQVGRELDVLIEGVGEGLSVGRSYRDAPEIDGLVLLPGLAEVGAFVRARITAAQEYDVVGERVSTAES